MARKNFTVEQIIVKLWEVELHCNQGKTITEDCRGLGITEETYYRWRKEYGGMNTGDPRRMQESGERECSLEKDGCRASVGFLNFQGRELKKLLNMFAFGCVSSTIRTPNNGFRTVPAYRDFKISPSGLIFLHCSKVITNNKIYGKIC